MLRILSGFCGPVPAVSQHSPHVHTLLGQGLAALPGQCLAPAVCLCSSLPVNPATLLGVHLPFAVPRALQREAGLSPFSVSALRQKCHTTCSVAVSQDPPSVSL